jgi:cyclopropane fatty-acyl-phospholipid synthase-like methyltransferase
MAGLDDWLAVARAGDLDDVRERILTGYKDGKPFTPYLPTIAVPSPVHCVLDFGCGLGRNFPYLQSIAEEVVGFDLPPMIERGRALGLQAQLTSDWQDVCSRSYDLIVATLVLQHVEPKACRGYLEDFARLAPATYLLTRVMSDFETNVLAAVAETRAFAAGECVEVEHDPSTHQLRVLGRAPFDEICRWQRGGHYEVLLRPRSRI